jgi:hypothetical protein
MFTEKNLNWFQYNSRRQCQALNDKTPNQMEQEYDEKLTQHLTSEIK